MTSHTPRRESGFTLVELLIVVLIIGILATIAIPVFNGQRNKAKNSAAQSSVRNALSAAKAFAATNDTYVGLTQGILTTDESSLTTGTPVGTPGSTANPSVVGLYAYAGTAVTGTTPASSVAAADSGIMLCATSKGDQSYCIRSNPAASPSVPDQFAKGSTLATAQTAGNFGTSW